MARLGYPPYPETAAILKASSVIPPRMSGLPFDSGRSGVRRTSRRDEKAVPPLHCGEGVLRRGAPLPDVGGERDALLYGKHGNLILSCYTSLDRGIMSRVNRIRLQPSQDRDTGTVRENVPENPGVPDGDIGTHPYRVSRVPAPCPARPTFVLWRRT